MTNAELEALRPWRGVLAAGAWCAFASVAAIPVSMVGFGFWPPPTTAAESFAQFEQSPALGLLALDALYLVINALVLPFYLALTIATWRTSRSLAAGALLFGAVGMALLFASNRSIEMMSLAQLHAAAGPQERTALLAVGEGFLAESKGSAFVAYYWLNAAALFQYAAAMDARSPFSKSTRAWGFAAAFLMLVPATFGTVGLVFALLSLPPWVVFAVLSGRRLLALAAEGKAESQLGGAP